MANAATKPVATKRVVERWKNIKLANAHGELVKVRVHVATETERIAFCADHKRHSKNFCGENENGWIFFCTEKQRVEDVGTVLPKVIVDPGHYFIAEPAPE